jgi:ferredoxin-NADP reductase
VRALAERMDGDVVLVYRVLREEDVVFREELETLSRERGIRVELVVGDHATAEGARLLSAGHLRELLPDLDDRDVYVCGPPAMTNALVKSVRGAGVHHHHIHAERFAL